MAVTAGGVGNETARSLTSVMDFATRSHARALSVLLLAVFLSILPGFFTIPPTDRDEARFAQATKQMIESGDYIDIRLQDEVRYKKPVGIYWLQAMTVQAGQVLGVPRALSTIWLYRIPSLLGAIGAVFFTYWAALAFVSRRAAVLAGLMLASCLILSIEGRLAKTDAALLATTVAAMGALARAYLPEQRAKLVGRASWMLPAIFWTALAAGVLLKGPVIAMFVGLAVGALCVVDRSARWLLALRPLPGLLWAAALVLPWFLAITLRAGDTFFAESLGRDLFSKLASGQESHGAPPGYYFLLFWVMFFPGATLAGLALPAVWASRREPGAKFLLAWIVPAWIVLEIVVTKLPHYVLPVYPAIAILIAGIVDARMLSRNRWLVHGVSWWFVIPLLSGIFGLVVLLYVGRKFGLLVWPVTGAAVVMGLLAWQLFRSDGAEHSLLRGVAAALLSAVALFGLVTPALNYVFPSATLAKLLRSNDCKEPLAVAVGYHELSLVFLTATSTRSTDAAAAAEFMRGGSCRFAYIEFRHERSFVQRAEAIGLSYSMVGRVEGVNMANGQTLSVALFRSGGPT